MPRRWIRRFKNKTGSSLIVLGALGLLLAFAIPLSRAGRQNQGQRRTETSSNWQEIDRLISE
ncbi:MAG: hypothetical protein ACREUU_15880, partial [Gammaproteobacteria bacterium]